MSKVKIGIIKEGKVPIDKRTPFSPIQAKETLNRFPGIELVVQSSDIRCFSDQEYIEQGLQIVTHIDDCDVLFGVKEVPIDQLIPNKTYFFFSHTIKKQAYNKDLLKAILSKNIRLVDYETLTDSKGARIVAFGRWAGIVGAYNGIWTYSKRNNLFNLRRACDCFDLEDLKNEFQKVKLPPINIIITGGGRVAKGAMEVLDVMKIKKVSPSDFLSKDYTIPVYTQLEPGDYHQHREDKPFQLDEFFKSPEAYNSTFLPFTSKADLLIACAYWDPKAPVLFTRQDMLKEAFKIRVIADITCDIEGSIPSTKRASTIDDPVYQYSASSDAIVKEEKEENITVMAVDNLPCELPRDASESFGNELINNVLPHLLGGDRENIIQRATIALEGHLNEKYQYLSDYVNS